MVENNNKIVNNSSHLISIAKNKSGDKMIKSLLKNASDNVLKCIQECALNILEKNVPLSKSEFSTLFRSKSFIRSIGKRKIAIPKLRKLCIAKSKLVPDVIRPVLKLYNLA